ncbi:MAG: transglycosylase SLT domain-containing protein [Thaumarchaeota archaeon]|nr:transglycosylase SLT domain-containing protein [Nitrososphaerota archaeon]
MDFRIVWGEDKRLSDVYRRNIQQVNNDPVLYASEADVSMPQRSETAGSAQAEIEAYIIATFGKSSTHALAIARCESNFRPDVISYTNDVGVFQINLASHGAQIAQTRIEQIAWLSNYKNNVDFAYQLFLKSGWNPWVCNKLI